MKKLQPKKETYRKISLDKILIGSNVRLDYENDKIIELAESIKQHGLLSPLIVEEKENGYEIIAGHRRFKAIYHLYNTENMDGFFEVDCIIKSAKNRIEMQLIENIQREDLKDYELEKAVKELIKSHGYTQKQAGKILGKSESWISSILRAGEFREKNPEAMQFNTGVVQEIARVPKEKQAEVIEKTIEKGSTIKAVREAKQIYSGTKKNTKNTEKTTSTNERDGRNKNCGNVPETIICPHCGKEIEV